MTKWTTGCRKSAWNRLEESADDAIFGNYSRPRYHGEWGVWRGLDDGRLPVPANDNARNIRKGARGHDHPALDLANQGELMDTPGMNRLAVGIFEYLSQMLDDQTPAAWLAYNDYESPDIDRVLDMGVSPEFLLRAWTAGEPCNHNEPALRTACGSSMDPQHAPGAVEMRIEPAVPERWEDVVGRDGEVKRVKRQAEPEKRYIYRVGNLRFRPDGSIKVPRPELKQAKGQAREDELRAEDVDTRLYDGAAIPTNPKTGEHQVEFIGGKSCPTVTGPDDTKCGSPGHRNNRTASSSDAAAVHFARERAREAAEETLHFTRVRLGERLFEALVDASSGVSFWVIGNGRDAKDWRAAQTGKELVRQAIRRLVSKTIVQNLSR